MPDDGWNEWSRHVLAELRRLNDCIERLEKRQAIIDGWAVQSRERWTAHKEEHTRENVALKAWASVSSAIAGMIAGAFAWLTK